MLLFRRSGFIAMFIVIALVATACGGSDSEGDDATTTTTSAAGDGGGDASDTTTTTMEPVSGDSGSTYCERVREAAASDETPLDFDFFGLSPEQLEAQFARNLEVFDEWRSLAPPEIKADVDLVFGFYGTFVERGNELGWDLEAMADDEFFNGDVDDPALDAAAVNLENHSRDVCGVDYTTISTDGGAPPPDDAEDDPIAAALKAFNLPADLLSEENVECLREELGAEFEANITPGWTPGAEEIPVLLAAIDTCGITLG